MRLCPRCNGCRWVCERQVDLPWEGELACGCGAPGEPCPVCNNRIDEDTEPDLLEDFEVENRRKVRDCDWLHEVKYE
jgi:hypothetical protein